jgi:hypothetical protein
LIDRTSPGFTSPTVATACQRERNHHTDVTCHVAAQFSHSR